MSEIAVKVLTSNLIPSVIQEVTFLRSGVQHEVRSIKDELERMQAFLKDADMKAEIADTASSPVQVWVKQMREVAHRIEDAIDEYTLKVTQVPECSGLPGLLCSLGLWIRTLLAHHEISFEIGDIRKSIENLRKEGETLRLNKSDQDSSSGSANSHAENSFNDLRNIDEAQLVGDRNSEELTKYLLAGDGDGAERTVVAVVGEGGIGKTAVVRNIFKKQKEDKSFDHYAWIAVSHSLKGDLLLRNVLQRFSEEDGNEFASGGVETMNMRSLKTKLEEYLKEKRYLIVFDDVSDKGFWTDVGNALPKDKKSSKIIITTRNTYVANTCKASHEDVYIYQLRGLSEHHALDLLHWKVFKSKPCPKNLMNLSREFVRKCKGVPLTIEAIAGLLSTKSANVHVWKEVLDNIGSKLRSHRYLIYRSSYQVLSESYDDLPYHLKLCILYFAIFPECYSIRCTRLIRLWIAEGIIKNKQNENRTLEEVAEEYLLELLNRSIVKVSQVDFSGKPRSCGVHDLMHSFLLSKCEELNFCHVIKSLRSSFDLAARRLSIHRANQDAAPEKAIDYSRVRYCLVFDFGMPNPLEISFFAGFKLLIGLDLEDSSLDHLPHQIGNLLLLRYLSLRNTNIKELPTSIGNLENLQTLDLKHTQVRELSFEIKRLIKIRHLIAYCVDENIDFSVNTLQGVKLRDGVGSLTSLQKLYFIDTSQSVGIIKELQKLTQLRKLGILKLEEQDGEPLCRAIEKMIHLRSLSIAATEDNKNLQLQSLTDPPPSLERLYLKGRLESLPRWIPRLQYLIRLRLNWSGLSNDPLPDLGELPALLELGLYNAYEGDDDLHFRKGSFQNLKVLTLQEMEGLKNIKIDDGALPVLEKMVLSGMKNMVKIPVDIEKLKQLEELRLSEMRDQLIDNMIQKDGEGYGILKRVSFVLINHHGMIFVLHHVLALNNEFGDEADEVIMRRLFEE